MGVPPLAGYLPAFIAQCWQAGNPVVASPIPTELGERSEAKFIVGMWIPLSFWRGSYLMKASFESQAGLLCLIENDYIDCNRVCEPS